jgi:hypothetical protein
MSQRKSLIRTPINLPPPSWAVSSSAVGGMVNSWAPPDNLIQIKSMTALLALNAGAEGRFRPPFGRNCTKDLAADENNVADR